jgi:anti-sigma B factor antagonist
MEINIEQENDVTIVQINGSIDAKTVSSVQEQVVPLNQPNSKILMDMSGVTFMSSAGLRMLLLMHQKSNTNKSKLALLGLSDQLTSTMKATGFLKFFTVVSSKEEGLTALQ